MGLSHLAELAQLQVTGQNIMNSESKHGQKADVVIGTINSYQTALSLTTHPLYAVSAQPAPKRMTGCRRLTAAVKASRASDFVWLLSTTEVGPIRSFIPTSSAALQLHQTVHSMRVLNFSCVPGQLCGWGG